MAHNLFVYGTLMFPEIRSALVGREFQTVPALLRGYRRSAVFFAGRAPVPAIVPDEEASVTGQVLKGVDRKSLRAFDTFEGVEGGLYRRERVAILDGEGRPLEVSTYVAGAAVGEMLKGDWDPEKFRKCYLGAYRRRIVAAWRN